MDSSVKNHSKRKAAGIGNIPLQVSKRRLKSKRFPRLFFSIGGLLPAAVSAMGIPSFMRICGGLQGKNL